MHEVLSKQGLAYFEAVRSAHAFLCLSRAIWWIGVAGCGLLWTSFYEDFISFSRPALASCTENTLVSLFKISAEEGDKCLPFDKVCDTLGVSFDLRGSCDGLAAVRNTDTRVQELCNGHAGNCRCWNFGRQTGTTAEEADAARGNPVLGRTGRRCLKVLSSFAEGE